MSEFGFGFELEAIIWVVAAYLIGSIAFGIIVSKLYRLPDPRSVGSGNIGATNVARSGKKSAAILTLLGDVFKGWLPVWLALHAGMLMDGWHWSAWQCFWGICTRFTTNSREVKGWPRHLV